MPCLQVWLVHQDLLLTGLFGNVGIIDGIKGNSLNPKAAVWHDSELVSNVKMSQLVCFGYKPLRIWW